MVDDVSTKEVALVTGGGSGIGRACAHAFAKSGKKVVIADVNYEEGLAAAEQICHRGGTAMFIGCDVSSLENVEMLIKRTVEAYGRLDCAVNNAGIQGDMASTDTCSKENWDRTIAINLTGAWHCMKCEISQMLTQGSGTIVNVSSNFGLVGSGAGMPAYSASKHGLIGLSKTAALECARSGIRVNAICPGPVETPLAENVFSSLPGDTSEIIESFKEGNPMGRFAKPEEIAQSIVWLCSGDASYITGAVLSADGGYVAQ